VFWAAAAAAVQQARLAAVQQLQGARVARQQQQRGVLLAQQQCRESQGSWGLCLVRACCILPPFAHT
jgi:hypothetical protein